ncbi:MAG: hypothetical protein QG581_384, partial [Patescibacteria group bacterium]|nr:hypothetical protein [Patescibacteria group bacterium]
MDDGKQRIVFPIQQHLSFYKVLYENSFDEIRFVAAFGNI